MVAQSLRIWIEDPSRPDRLLFEPQNGQVRIGRAPENDLRLQAPLVAKNVALLEWTGRDWEIEALDMRGLVIGDRQLYSGGRSAVADADVIRIFPYTLSIELVDGDVASPEAMHRALDREMAAFVQAVHVELLNRMGRSADSGATQVQGEAELLALERLIDLVSQSLGLLAPEKTELVRHLAGYCIRAELLAMVSKDTDVSREIGSDADKKWTTMVSAVPQRELVLRNIVQRVAQRLDVERQEDAAAKVDLADSHFWEAWDTICGNLTSDVLEYAALRHVKKEIKDSVFGYGPLEDLLRMPIISEIMVVDRDHIYIEKGGVVKNSGRQFVSDQVTEAIIQRIVGQVGRSINRSRPLVDARLSDGSRVNAVIAPLAVSGPCLTIRRFPLRKQLVADLVAKRSLTSTVAKFLRAAVIHRANIIVSGGTGTGKTTLLNCLSDFIPDNERIVTVEDTAELRLTKEHVVRLETKEKNIEGTGQYTIRDLVKNALRMRPDRIVVGECRSGEALDMLQAMNTGHDGSLTTIHANSAEDVILRLEVLVQMAGENLPVSSIHRQIASAIDLIVQLSRLRNGRRCVSQVSQVMGIDGETGGVKLKDIFLKDPTDDDAELVPTGSLPTFIDSLIAAKLIDIESFYQ